MASDLEAVDALAQVIGVMNGPAREPEHLFLELAQDLELRCRNGFAGAGGGHRYLAVVMPANAGIQ